MFPFVTKVLSGMIDHGPFHVGQYCGGLQHKDEDVGHDSPNSEGNALLVLFFIDLMAGTHMLVPGTSEVTVGLTCNRPSYSWIRIRAALKE